MGRSASSGGVVTLAFGLETAAQLLRTLVLARLLPPQEFGLAVTASLLFGIVEIITMGGAERFLIFARHGGSRRTLGVMHSIWLLRGIVAGLLVLGLAWPFAWLVGHPEAAQSFAWLALASALRGLAHLRTIQFQRIGRYWPDASAVIVSNLAGLGVAAAWGWWWRDHSAVVAGLVTSCAVHALVTWLWMGRIPWRPTWHRSTLREALAYGLPLTGNGLALAVLGQVDRLVVAALLGAAVLASYSLAIMMLILPTTLISRVAVPWLQPALSAAWHVDPSGGYRLRFGAVNEALILLALLGACVATGLGDAVLGLVFGADYRVGDKVFALFGVAFFFRVGRVSFNLAGLAAGHTMALLRANLFAAMTLPVTALALWLAPVLEVAACGFVLAEVVGCLAAAHALRGGAVPHGALVPWLALAAGALAWGGVIVALDPDLAFRLAGLALLIMGVAAVSWVRLRGWITSK